MEAEQVNKKYANILKTLDEETKIASIELKIVNLKNTVKAIQDTIDSVTKKLNAFYMEADKDVVREDMEAMDANYGRIADAYHERLRKLISKKQKNVKELEKLENKLNYIKKLKL